MSIEQLYEIYQQNPSVQTDTRKLKEGDIFFALKGGNFNGNNFAKQAINDGAVYAVIDEKEFDIPGKTILVDDVLNTLQQLAKYHRQQFDIPFIAITGTPEALTIFSVFEPTKISRIPVAPLVPITTRSIELFEM